MHDTPPDDAPADQPSALPSPPAEKLRGLARTIAKAGWATRVNAEAMVRAGRVRVNGRLERDPQLGVSPNADIRIDGERLVEAPRHYFAWHKPAHVSVGPGERDRRRAAPEGLPPGIPGLRPAGRLDAESTGLVLISNDAAWNANATGGAGLDKEYLVRVVGELNELELGLLTAGMRISRLGLVRPASAGVEEMGEGWTLLRLVMIEGKNRQIRRLFSTLRHDVLALHRIRVGPVSLGDLSPNQVRPLEPLEIERIRRGNLKRRRLGAPRREGSGHAPPGAP